MIRHLPIKKVPSDRKKKLSKLVQRVINSLLQSNGAYNEDILSKIREIEDITFDLYDLENSERDTIITDIKNRVGLYKSVYD